MFFMKQYIAYWLMDGKPTVKDDLSKCRIGRNGKCKCGFGVGNAWQSIEVTNPGNLNHWHNHPTISGIKSLMRLPK